MLHENFSGFKIECGTDEAGRGCLAGPVTAAAIILPKDLILESLNDSKQLSEKTRVKLKPLIEEKALTFAFTHIFNEEIDEINILNASMKAMQESILKLSTKPEFIIVDGNRPIFSKLGIKTVSGYNFSEEEIIHLKSIPNQSIIKGDGKYLSIAAASVLAKTYRDEYMDKIHEEFPMYNWKKNKGYPTKEHREAIAKYGITKYHRKSFRLLPEQLELDFEF
ncbi:ribonuclease HII [Flavobacterium sp. H122]|uniref:ribonuclease HII n=1 Tax=Flavobacterium sp. H122 TaxID=2529860 RepID=UPI0010A9EEFC|nr:ribonuclease HII [Flavobacterium sp. H122]